MNNFGLEMATRVQYLMESSLARDVLELESSDYHGCD